MSRSVCMCVCVCVCVPFGNLAITVGTHSIGIIFPFTVSSECLAY